MERASGGWVAARMIMQGQMEKYTEQCRSDISSCIPIYYIERINMLTGVKCLVTGASSGIGKSCCAVMTRHGASVFGTGK